ncbi:23S rRNA (adenine(2030)-N(6))-methyltransferase RlmJ [Oryzibacter oryziterrae]|uniref:23S rRNA (adenine(2030)-N(6))-methyltransferase RlmJ n=1 Tax=Oryzibacter oryziterrae TaxID=2766474 RepID=UPI001F02B3BB|nr:23S rRNA (adenine(2030)-N(6))-methyltransferase RlmJ [Oryzibacter oryziterrae]
MNYRHAYHAGNFADVLKHAVLARILAYLCKKDAAFRVIDTHSGIGLYDLASDEALKTGEWRNGVGRILESDLSEPLRAYLGPWMGAIRAANGDDNLLVYPGSPMIATTLGRLQDRFLFNELHPEDAQQLDALYSADRRVQISRENGYVTVRAQLPPRERRGVVVIDPPFEEAGEFQRMLRAMQDASRRFATGIQLLWYPIKDQDAVDAFLSEAADTGATRLLCIEQWIREPGGDGPLAGAGMLVVNPPYMLAEETRAIMPELIELLADGPGAGGRVTWLVEEADRSGA